MLNPENKPVIAVDIDEVLTPHFQYLIDWYNQKYGTELTLANNHPKEPTGWGTDSIPEAIKRVHKFFDTDEFKNSKPFEEAKSAVRKLSQNYEMIVITARDTIIEQVTCEWLDEHFKELFSEAHFTAGYSLEGKFRTKTEVGLRAGASYLIDDALDHCQDAAKAGITALLFGDYPWNQAEELPSDVIRVKDWQMVLEYFEEK